MTSKINHETGKWSYQYKIILFCTGLHENFSRLLLCCSLSFQSKLALPFSSNQSMNGKNLNTPDVSTWVHFTWGIESSVDDGFECCLSVIIHLGVIWPVSPKNQHFRVCACTRKSDTVYTHAILFDLTTGINLFTK